MALRYNDQTGEFEETGGGLPRRPFRRTSGGGGWNSDMVIGCSVLALIGVGAFFLLKSVVKALLGSKWFWILLVLGLIGYSKSKNN